jgi:hypothetical protein
MCIRFSYDDRVLNATPSIPKASTMIQIPGSPSQLQLSGVAELMISVFLFLNPSPPLSSLNSATPDIYVSTETN